MEDRKTAVAIRNVSITEVKFVQFTTPVTRHQHLVKSKRYSIFDKELLHYQPRSNKGERTDGRTILSMRVRWEGDRAKNIKIQFETDT
jgi:hypothetical protein